MTSFLGKIDSPIVSVVMVVAAEQAPQPRNGVLFLRPRY